MVEQRMGHRATAACLPACLPAGCIEPPSEAICVPVCCCLQRAAPVLPYPLVLGCVKFIGPGRQSS